MADLDKNDNILSEWNDAVSVQPDIQFEEALREIRDEYNHPITSKIPFTEIAALGGAFSGVIEKFPIAGQGIYRCVFPGGVYGNAHLAAFKDGTGYLGTIMNNHGIVGQARWQPLGKGIAPACIKAALIAVAVLAVVKQINIIKNTTKEILEMLERDKRSLLLADYDILTDYIDNYKYYCENKTVVLANLCQVKNIKRNSVKDIKSYSEQLKNYVEEKESILNAVKKKNAPQRISSIMECFIHYKLSYNVYALSEYLDVLLSQDFQPAYLEKISNDIREKAQEYISVYSQCYDKINEIRTMAISTKVSEKVAGTSKTIGKFIGKVPKIKNGPVDEILIGIGDHLDESKEKRLEKDLERFSQYKQSGIVPIAEHIEAINTMANKPVVMVYDKDGIVFCDCQCAV